MIKTILSKPTVKILIAFLAGAIWLVAMRFVTLKNNEVHYHANFAVFVEGQRLAFESPLYYEEVQSCGGDEVNNPKTRAHMHDQISDVVHVHDDAATWGHFFANLGITNGDTVFRYNGVVHVEDTNTNIRFILNGEEVDTTANRTINSEDTLLISVGNPTSEEVQEQYSQIVKNAGEYNEQHDPASCSGGKELSNSERLKKSIGIFGE